MTNHVRVRGRIWLVIVIGLVLLVVAAVLFFRNISTPTNAGDLPTSASAVPSREAATSTAVTVSSVRGSLSSSSAPAMAARRSTAPPPAAATNTTTDTATTGSSMAPDLGHPAVLHLPTLGVTAGIDPVDSDHGVLQVPEDISRVGWWKHSVNPGSAAGSTVIDGHIDSAVAGEGALFHLADLGPGDPVAVTTSTGATVHYRVQARRVYVKEQGLPADLFDQQGPGRLVIISCGGPFDRSIRSYEDNIAILATATT